MIIVVMDHWSRLKSCCPNKPANDYDDDDNDGDDAAAPDDDDD